MSREVLAHVCIVAQCYCSLTESSPRLTVIVLDSHHRGPFCTERETEAVLDSHHRGPFCTERETEAERTHTHTHTHTHARACVRARMYL